jgi:ABC-type branched-subunit amino acid transport system substrate-binding protein
MTQRGTDRPSAFEHWERPKSPSGYLACPIGEVAALRLKCVNGELLSVPRTGRTGHMRFGASRISWSLPLATLLLLACGAEDPQSVKVAVAVPFAGTGLMQDARQAWELVLDEINDGGGVNGKRLEVHERDTPLDDAADLRPVADGVVDLTDEGYKYIISLVSGAAVEPIMNATLPHGVLTMSITSEESATNLPEYDGMLLRGILPTDQLLEKQAALMQAAGMRSMAVVGPTTAGVVDVRHSAMEAAYAACATCTVTSVTYPAEADLYRYDWESVGTAATARAPDVIFLASADPSALLDIIHWSERTGFSGLYYFAYGAYMGSLLPALPGSAAPPRFRSYDLGLPPNSRLDHFLSSYEQKYGNAFVPEPRLIAFADYLALLALAMTAVGDEDPHEVAAAMKAIAGPPGDEYGALDYVQAAAAVRAGQDIDFLGLSGPLDFDGRGEVSDGYIQQYGINSAGEVAPLP